MNNIECLESWAIVRAGTMCKALKYFIIICLVATFLVILSNSIKDISRGRTTYAYSMEKSKTLLPSWTLCPFLRPEYSIPVDKVIERLENGTKIPFNLTFVWESKLITDKNVVKDLGFNWEDIWSINCMFFKNVPNSQCIPCVTFIPPNDTFLGTTPVK